MPVPRWGFEPNAAACTQISADRLLALTACLRQHEAQLLARLLVELKEGCMRVQTSLVAILTAVAVAALVGWGFAAPALGPTVADNRPSAVPVDTELVLAVDISYS